MKDEIKEIIEYLKCEEEYYDGIEEVVLSSDEKVIERDDIELLLDYITNLQEENQRLKDIRNQAITYNKALCKIYDCGIELSNAETNLCILKDEETINTLQGKSDNSE